MSEQPDLDAFDAQAARLAAHIAAAEAAGEAVPEEARAMLASLQELARAVEGLRQSLGEEQRKDA
ncbi:hypothetical protein J421_1633 [Gemmatirosa kalamazoonensis]|uniref:Uncharacterized protein n=1 Tax=Gemmatirosa kalamazoonensis TaxID=861299 RepID=W0RFQ0_9BACT|nr:hypothetical protein [Gemmatirosa kalamazoonensis]AHG89170.1 hypothetical protein J421_1633 [Gemmatirosa kalamazoonensis]